MAQNYIGSFSPEIQEEIIVVLPDSLLIDSSDTTVIVSKPTSDDSRMQTINWFVREFDSAVRGAMKTRSRPNFNPNPIIDYDYDSDPSSDDFQKSFRYSLLESKLFQFGLTLFDRFYISSNIQPHTSISILKEIMVMCFFIANKIVFLVDFTVETMYLMLNRTSFLDLDEASKIRVIGMYIELEKIILSTLRYETSHKTLSTAVSDLLRKRNKEYILAIGMTDLIMLNVGYITYQVEELAHFIVQFVRIFRMDSVAVSMFLMNHPIYCFMYKFLRSFGASKFYPLKAWVGRSGLLDHRIGDVDIAIPYNIRLAYIFPRPVGIPILKTRNEDLKIYSRPDFISKQFHGKLGEGSNAIVSKEYIGGEMQALKKVKITYDNSEIGITFGSLREIDILTRIFHPNIIRIRGVYSDCIDIYMALELASYTLKQEIDHLQSINKHLPHQIKIKYIVQITEAIKYIHSIGIIHRDLNVANILVDATDPINPKIKLCDFGNSTNSPKGSYPSRSSMSIDVCASYFRAIELFLRNPSYNEKVDTWALGCVIYYILFADYPFKGSTDYAILQDIYFKLGFPTKDYYPQLTLLDGYIYNPLLVQRNNTNLTPRGIATVRGVGITTLDKHQPEIAPIIYSMLLYDPDSRPFLSHVLEFFSRPYNLNPNPKTVFDVTMGKVNGFNSAGLHFSSLVDQSRNIAPDRHTLVSPYANPTGSKSKISKNAQTKFARKIQTEEVLPPEKLPRISKVHLEIPIPNLRSNPRPDLPSNENLIPNSIPIPTLECGPSFSIKNVSAPVLNSNSLGLQVPQISPTQTQACIPKSSKFNWVEVEGKPKPKPYVPSVTRPRSKRPSMIRKVLVPNITPEQAKAIKLNKKIEAGKTLRKRGSMNPE